MNISKAYFIFVPWIIGLLLNLSLTYSVDASPTGSIRVGYYCRSTGTGMFMSTSTQRGARVAVDELNSRRKVEQEGRVELIVEDIAGRVPNAVSAVMKLLSQDKVDAIVCDLTAPCLAVAGKIEEAGKVLIYHSPSRATAINRRQSLRNFIDYTVACRMMVERFNEKEIVAIGGVNAHLEFGELCYQGMLSATETSYSIRYNPGEDFRSIPIDLKKRRIEHVVFTGFEHDFVSLIKMARSQNLNLNYGFIEILLTESLWQQLGQVSFKGVTAGFTEMSQGFKEKLKSTFPKLYKQTSSSAALAYNAVHSLVESIDLCPNKSLDCLLAELSKPRMHLEMGFSGLGEDKITYPIVIKDFSSEGVGTLN